MTVPPLHNLSPTERRDAVRELIERGRTGIVAVFEQACTIDCAPQLLAEMAPDLTVEIGIAMLPDSQSTLR